MKQNTRSNSNRPGRCSTAPVLSLAIVAILVVPWCTLAEPSEAYDEARKALDAKQYERALDLYREAESLKDRQSEAAVYWQAWTYYKMARERDALNTITRLEDAYPNSRWRDDAADLRAEISGEISSEQEIKLLAISGILNTDPERAADELEKLLQRNGSAQLKEQALFLLVQSGDPRATEIVVRHARDASDPATQRVASRTLALMGDDDSQAVLADIYGSTSDTELKRVILEGWMMVGDESRVLGVARDTTSPELRDAAIEGLTMMGAFDSLEALYEENRDPRIRMALLQGYMMAGKVEPVLEAAKNDDSPEVRRQAIQLLGMMGATSEVWELYQDESSVETKRAILDGLIMASDVERLTEIATSESNRELRGQAIHGLGIAGGSAATETLKRIYEGESDRDLRSAALEGLAIQGSAPELIAIARSETDPELRREIVRVLSMMGSEEATDYLLELLED